MVKIRFGKKMLKSNINIKRDAEPNYFVVGFISKIYDDRNIH